MPGVGHPEDMDLSRHEYAVTVEWTGNRGPGTTSYRAYGRDHVVRAAGVPDLLASADSTFHGDRARWNPELLLLAALSECHMLSYLHVATRHEVVVSGYRDRARGVLRLNPNGSGQFTAAVLHPDVQLVDEAQRALADRLHDEAHDLCFIARSVNFDVSVEPARP